MDDILAKHFWNTFLCEYKNMLSGCKLCVCMCILKSKLDKFMGWQGRSVFFLFFKVIKKIQVTQIKINVIT